MRRTKLYQLMAVAGCLSTAVAVTPVLADDSVTVNVNDNKDSAYQVSVTNNGNSWTYTIAQTNGRALSHWDLSLGNCLDHVESTDGGEILPGGDPSNASPGEGADPSVKSSPLIKWDTQGGTFTVTLDDTYPAGTVSVLAKTGTMYGTGTITGPDCSTPVDDTPVDDTPVDDTPVDDTPVDDTPVDDTPVDNGGGNPNMACSEIMGSNGAPMSLIDKFEWSGNSYAHESGTGAVSVDGDASGGTFSSIGTVKVAAVIVKGGTVALVDQDGNDSFSKAGLTNKGGQTADISNIQFCQEGVFDSAGAEVCLWSANKDADGNYINIEQVGCVDAEKGKFYAIKAAGEFSNALEAE